MKKNKLVGMGKYLIVLLFGLIAEVKFYNSLLRKKGNNFIWPDCMDACFLQPSETLDGLIQTGWRPERWIVSTRFSEISNEEKEEGLQCVHLLETSENPHSSQQNYTKKFSDLLPKSTNFYHESGCGAFHIHPSQGQQNSFFHTKEKEADLKAT